MHKETVSKRDGERDKILNLKDLVSRLQRDLSKTKFFMKVSFDRVDENCFVSLR